MSPVPALFIASPAAISGKTNLCLGLALKFREEGYRVGYFRPLGVEAQRLQGVSLDEDVLMMKEALGLSEPLKRLCPILYGERLLSRLLEVEPKELMEKVLESYAESSREKDLMIVEAARTPGYGCLLGLPAPFVAGQLNAKVLLVSRFEGEAMVGDILCSAEQFRRSGIPCLGIVLNEVRGDAEGRVREIVQPLLEKRGLELLGILPFNPALTAPTVAEVKEKLSAELLAGHGGMEKVVRGFMVGAMTPESALAFFRKAAEKAVITGGDRSDIALTALETSTSALILTGNLYPPTSVLTRAEEKGIPVLLVPYDTYGTVERISGLTGKIRPEDKAKVRLAKETVEEHVNWRRILEMTLDQGPQRLPKP